MLQLSGPRPLLFLGGKMSIISPRILRFLIGAVVLLCTMSALLYWWQQSERSAQRQRKNASDLLVQGRHATARRILIDLTERRPNDREALYLLGLCEQSLGQTERAEAAWKRIPSGTSQAALVALHHARQEQARGRLSRAEELFLEALKIPGPHRPFARWDLVQLWRLEGRIDEARDLFRSGIAEHPEPAEALRILLKFDADAYPAESAGEQFAQALKLAPDDDRVWLGLANVALAQGRLDEAATWLDRCEAARPADQSVARARLAWALAADRPKAVVRALKTIPTTSSPEDRLLAAEAGVYLADKTQDDSVGREMLKRFESIFTKNPRTLDILAQKALAANDPARAAEYRLLRSKYEADWRAYIASITQPYPRNRASDLADRAKHIDRHFDQAAWNALAKTKPESDEERKALQSISQFDSPVTGKSLYSWIESSLPSVDWKKLGETRALHVNIPKFVDAGDSTKLSSFLHQTGHVEGRLTLPETGAGGVALLDYDGDRLLDVYAIQAGPFPAPADAKSADKLFRNRGDGTFEDVSSRAGITAMKGGYGHGVESGDFDNDGHPDLFITRWRAYQLLRNRGDGTFEDVTELVGFAGDRDWPTSAAFADFDDDGDLDLYVCHYLKWDEVNDRTCIDPNNPSRYSCIPLDFPAQPDRLFRNDSGRFTDVTAKAGISDLNGRGLGVVATDVDSDGRIDLFVANDMTANYLWHNVGDLKFEEIGMTAGVGCNAMGGYQAGMGVATGDLDGDGLLDLCVTNYYGESTSFFKNLGDGFFADRTSAIGLAAPSRDRLGFGLTLPDTNNDGHLDLLSANGHVHDGRPSFPWKMRPQLLVGTRPLEGKSDGRLRDVSDEAGAPFEKLVLGRGLATGDLNNDGKLDAVLVAQGGPLMVLMNQTPDAGNWLSLRLEGVESNRDAIGTIVTIEANGQKQVATRYGGGSFQSASDPRLHFGLGDATHIEHVEVHWPSGHVEAISGLEAGRTYRVREGTREATAE
jgi:enediyne biosynthesis protein E4